MLFDFILSILKSTNKYIDYKKFNFSSTSKNIKRSKSNMSFHNGKIAQNSKLLCVKTNA